MKFDEAVQKCIAFDEKYEENSKLRRELEQKLREIEDNSPTNPCRTLRSVLPISDKWRLSIYVGLSYNPRDCYDFHILYEKTEDGWTAADAVTALCEITNTERDAIVNIICLLKQWKENKIDWPWPLLTEEESREKIH